MIWSAACRIRMRPTLVEPVKVSLRTLSFSVNSLPMEEESVPVTTLKMPAGTPARSARIASDSAESGVSAAGFDTMAQPTAMAGAILRASMAFGKFHGVMEATTPTGCLMMMIRLSP